MEKSQLHDDALRRELAQGVGDEGRKTPFGTPKHPHRDHEATSGGSMGGSKLLTKEEEQNFNRVVGTPAIKETKGGGMKS